MDCFPIYLQSYYSFTNFFKLLRILTLLFKEKTRFISHFTVFLYIAREYYSLTHSSMGSSNQTYQNHLLDSEEYVSVGSVWVETKNVCIQSHQEVLTCTPKSKNHCIPLRKYIQFTHRKRKKPIKKKKQPYKLS